MVVGRIAQLGEHSPYKAGVTGSSPVPPTIDFAPGKVGVMD
jgi:hypothetical protein